MGIDAPALKFVMTLKIWYLFKNWLLILEYISRYLRRENDAKF
jgi:hypothetical protein